MSTFMMLSLLIPIHHQFFQVLLWVGLTSREEPCESRLLFKCLRYRGFRQKVIGLQLRLQKLEGILMQLDLWLLLFWGLRLLRLLRTATVRLLLRFWRLLINWLLELWLGIRHDIDLPFALLAFLP